jgi:hypothetical protein
MTQEAYEIRAPTAESPLAENEHYPLLMKTINTTADGGTVMAWRETSYALDKYRQEGCQHNLIFAFGNTDEVVLQFHGSNNQGGVCMRRQK